MRPLALRSAGQEGTATSVVCHVGRRSGRAYQTPVVVTRHDDSFLIALPYGERTDWLKNVLAARSATIMADGCSYEVDWPEVIPMADATAYFRPREQRMHRQFHVDTALEVHQHREDPASRPGLVIPGDQAHPGHAAAGSSQPWALNRGTSHGGAHARPPAAGTGLTGAC